MSVNYPNNSSGYTSAIRIWKNQRRECTNCQHIIMSGWSLFICRQLIKLPKGNATDLPLTTVS